MKRDFSLVFVLGIILLSSLKLSAQIGFKGEYINEKGNKILILKDDFTFLLNDNTDFGPLMPLWRLKTLSYGYWEYKDGFIILNTQKDIESRTLKMIVEEEHIQGNDSLIITISNPYEVYFSEYGGVRVFKYSLFIDDFNGDLAGDDYLEGNVARFYLPQGHRINGVMLWIIPDSFLYPGDLAFNFLLTDYVRLKNSESNALNIEIPDFTLEYIGYERYNNEHIIIRNEELIFRGDVFTKREEDDYEN